MLASLDRELACVKRNKLHTVSHFSQHQIRMDYDALRLFVHLSRSLHFGRTSRQCHASPSALSRTIQRMEAELGHALFIRDQRTVTLTREGELFRRHAVDTLARYESVQQELDHGGERLHGTLSLFASVTACQSFLPPLLSAFRSQHPDIHLQLETGYAVNALEMLEQDVVDVAIAALPERIPNTLVARALLHTPLVFVAPVLACRATEWLSERPIPWARVPMVLPASGLARASADQWFKRRRVSPEVYGELAGNEAILSLVSLGCGVGVVPRLVAEQSPLRESLRVLEVEPRVGEFRIGVCSARRKYEQPIVRAFWDTLAASS